MEKEYNPTMLYNFAERDCLCMDYVRCKDYDYSSPEAREKIRAD